MNELMIKEQRYALDTHGFLLHRLEWNRQLAEHFAALDEIELSAEHWFVIDYFREYFEDYNIPPPMRMVVRRFRNAFGESNANSRYLHQLFPGGPTRTASKYAGLPKPKNCK